MAETQPFIVTATMLSLGASTLAPWLAYIAAADFFIDTYPDADLMYVFPVQNFLVLVTGSIALMTYGERLPLSQRIVMPQVALVGCLAVVPALNLLDVDHALSLRLTLLAQLAGAVCVTVYQSASYGAGAMLGPSVTNSLEAGKGIGGVGIILARCVAKALLPSTPAGLAASTNAFFVFSNCLVVASVLFWSAMLKDPYARSRIDAYETQRVASNKAAAATAAAATAGSNVRAGAASSAEKGRAVARGTTSKGEKATLLAGSGQGGGDKAGSGAVLDTDDAREDSGAVSSMGSVLCALAAPAGVVTCGFMVCLSCFPGLTTSLQSRTLGLGDWFPVLLVASYNVSDMVGKSLPSVVGLLFDARTLPYASALHLLFIPLFLVVARSDPTAATSDPASEDGFLPSCGPFLARAVASDEFAFALVASLGLTTGYVTCSAMMLGPGCVSKPQDRVLAGQMMTCCLMLGLFAGSMLGVLLSLVS